jgi:UDPglucose 6-dehydrogenase
VSAAFAGVVRGKTVAVLGLTFKPNTDDMRDAPSIPLITALLDMGAKVRVYDPVGMEQAKQVLADVTYAKDHTSASKTLMLQSSSPSGNRSVHLNWKDCGMSWRAR